MQTPFDPKVFQLGFVALETTDLTRASEHYAEHIGMTETDVGPDGERYLSVGFEHHNIVLRQAVQKSLLHMGYQLKPEIDLSAFAKEVADHGFKVETKTDSQPGIAQLVQVYGPGGVVFQFYKDIASPAPGFKRSGVSPMRLGHAAVISSDGEKLVQFYTDILGFRGTDTIGGVANFLTCNRDHHVINVLAVPEDRVHHIAFELKGNASHAMACDNLRERGVMTKWGPARHTAGHNLASYHYDPDEVLVELYTDMDVYIPELDMCEARPWHEHLPMKPKDWELSELCAWETEFTFDLAKG